MADTIEAQVQKLTVEPGDVVVITVPGQISLDMHEALQSAYQKAMADAPYIPKALVLDGGKTVAVLNVVNPKDVLFASRHNDETGECETVDLGPDQVSRIREKVAPPRDWNAFDPAKGGVTKP